MSDPRLRRIDARPVSPEVAEYRLRVGLSGVPQGEREAAEELIKLCRFRNRPALLRSNLRFGRNLIAIRVSDLDGDGINEILVVDSEQTVHTLKHQPGRDDAWGSGPGWIVGAQRYRGKMLGLSFSGFGVFRRKEAIITSLEEHTDSNVYHEMKLTCDGLQWDVSELMHRRPSGEGGIRLIGESCEPGRVPVLRVQGGRMVVEILDDRHPGRVGREAGRVIQLGGEVAGMVLCEEDLVVAYARGGLQRITREGRPRQILFPHWTFSSLAYASPRMLGGQGPEGGLLIGGTTSGHVMAIDLRRGAVLWRMDAGFLFSCVALYDLEGSGRVDLLLGGMDGGLRIYELTDGALIEERCQKLYLQLGPRAQPLLEGLVAPGHEAYAAVQLYLLSRILDGQGHASDAVVKLVRWFTPGQNGWHMLPERAQKEAIAMLERFLLIHVPHVPPAEPLSTITGPFPLLGRESSPDPQSAALLVRAILAELVDIYLSAPRLVRRQIDRISRRLLEQYWLGYRGAAEPEPEATDRHPLPELKRLLNVRGLRAREYAQAVRVEVDGVLRRISLLPEGIRPNTGPGSDLLSRIVRAIGLLEEARAERFSMEFERLDLSHAVIDGGEGGDTCWVAGIGKNGRLRMELIAMRHKGAASDLFLGPHGSWDAGIETTFPPALSYETALPGLPRFVEARRVPHRGRSVLRLIVGTDERSTTRVQLYEVSPKGLQQIGDDLLIHGAADPIGFEWHEGPGAPGMEVLLLRVPGSAERESAGVVAIDISSPGPRTCEHLAPGDLLAATASEHASLHVTASRVIWRPRAGRALSAPAPAEGRCCALSPDGRTLAVGTTAGLVQLFQVVSDSLILTGQHLLPKGISALCFIPGAVFGELALAIGSEDEQVHIFACGERRRGDELARLLVGGSPSRMACLPYSEERAGREEVAGYRMALSLSGSVAATWGAPLQVSDEAVLSDLWELASRAAGSRRRALAAALTGPGPHARAAALRQVLGETRGPQELLSLVGALLCDGPSDLPGEAERAEAWRLLHPERNHIVLGVLCEALMPVALGMTSHPQEPLLTARARELLAQVLRLSDEPLSIRAALLRAVERCIDRERVPALLTFMPQLLLEDARASTWPFFVDSIGALLIQHARRMVRMGAFVEAEEFLFGLVVTVLDAVLPSLPSRFLLTEVALLLHAYLPWSRARWAGNLGRVRLHLPHAIIAALCQPAIIPDADARAFLIAVSRRWGPRLPLTGWEDGDDLQSGFAQMSASDEGDIEWRLRAGVENGFDQTYYERLADELTRHTRPDALDAWDLADTVQAVLRLFDFRNLTELVASLQQPSVERSLQAIESHRLGQRREDPGGRYRDIAWSFLKEDIYDTERRLLLGDLARLDRKQSKARLARSLEEIAAVLEERRVRLESQIVTELSAYVSQAVLAPDDGALDETLVVPSGRYAACLLSVRASATVVALMMKWWDVLMEEAARIRTEADFDVRMAADLGVQDGWRTLRYAIALSQDTTRPAHGVLISVGKCEPPEIRVRVSSSHPVDLEPGRELSLYIDCPMQQAADGMRYHAEIELRHDDGKRTERVIEGQLSRDVRGRARSLFDSFAERLPTVFSQRCKRLHGLLSSPNAAVALLTSFSAHAYELLAEVLRLEWPDRPVDTFDGWRMVNLAVRHAPLMLTGAYPHGTPLTSSSLRDILQQIGARLGMALGIEGAERLDTVEAILRAVSEAPPVLSPQGSPKGLLILGLPELCDKARLEEDEQRQLLGLGARLCMSYRGRALVLLSPQAAALSLDVEAPAAAGAQHGEDGGARVLEMLDLDHVADPISHTRSDERAREELAQALSGMLAAAHKEGERPEGARFSAALTQGVRALIDLTGTDLRLIAECLPLLEQTLRERSRTQLGISAIEGRIGSYLTPVWRALPLRHRLYLAALCCDAVEIDVADLVPGLHVDGHVHSISGKDRAPTSKVVVLAGARLDEHAIEDIKRVMWLKKVRVRGSLQDSRTVLWTYLRQMKPRNVPQKHQSGRASERLLGATMHELGQLGLLCHTQLSGERQLVVFTSPAVREWLRSFLGLSEGEVGLSGSVDGRNLVRQLPLWDAAAVDQILGGSSPRLRAVLGRGSAGSAATSARWQEFLELSRAARRWIEGRDEHRFAEAIADYFRLDLVEGTTWESPGDEAQPGRVPMRSVQIRFRDQRQIPWLKRVVLYLPAGQPGRATLDQVQLDLRARVPMAAGGHSGPHLAPRPDAAYAGVDWTISDTALSAIVVVPEITSEVLAWSRNLFHVAAIDVSDLQHAALNENPVEELIRRLAAAASYAALSPFRSKMGLANQELIEEMFYGRRALLEEIRGQRHENFIIVGPRKIGKTSLLQRVRFELEQQGYRVIPRGMDYTTAPDSKEVLRALIRDLMEDLDPVRAGLGGSPSLRQVVDLWGQRHKDRDIAIVLDEIDTILRAERRAYLLGEWREAGAIGEALAGLLPADLAVDDVRAARIDAALVAAGFTRDVIEGVLSGLRTEPAARRAPALLEELRSASALVRRGGAVCRVILAGHAELAEARRDLFGPLLNFAKLRFLGPLDDASAERMVREPFARLGLRFESAAAENLLLQQTFGLPAWLQHCGALIIQSIDERLRSSRREEQRITERDVILALERVHSEERQALQSENGLYMLGPECSFVLFALKDESWFTIDFAVEFLRCWYESLDAQHRAVISTREKDYIDAFSPEVVRRIIRDLTNTFYTISDEVVSQDAASLKGPGAGSERAHSGELPRERLRRTYRVRTSMVNAVFRDELTVPKLIELARRGMRLWQEGRGVWARASGKPLQ